MRNKWIKLLALLLPYLAVFLLSGCIGASDGPTSASGKQSANDPKDPVAQEKQGGGWDDFPNKYKPTLLDLEANARQLPVPYGTRYEALFSGSGKRAAVPACTGDSSVFKYQSKGDDFFLYDTTTYYDSNAIAHCTPQGGSRAGEKHVRRIVELGVGEAWETIRDSITDQDLLPRHTVHGTGSFRLESGREFTIRSYDMTLLTQFGTLDAYVVDANMELIYQAGYTIRLGLALPHPYKAIDFFPVEGPRENTLVMTGPITHASDKGGIDTVGYVDLLGDHTLRIRDWTGAGVAP